GAARSCYEEGPGGRLAGRGGVADETEYALVSWAGVRRRRATENNQGVLVLVAPWRFDEAGRQVTHACDAVHIAHVQPVIERQGRARPDAPLPHEDHPEAAGDRVPGPERQGTQISWHVVVGQKQVCRGEREPRRNVFCFDVIVHARSVTSTTDKTAVPTNRMEIRSVAQGEVATPLGGDGWESTVP